MLLLAPLQSHDLQIERDVGLLQVCLEPGFCRACPGLAAMPWSVWPPTLAEATELVCAFGPTPPPPPPQPRTLGTGVLACYELHHLQRHMCNSLMMISFFSLFHGTEDETSSLASC